MSTKQENDFLTKEQEEAIQDIIDIYALVFHTWMNCPESRYAAVNHAKYDCFCKVRDVIDKIIGEHVNGESNNGASCWETYKE